MNASGHPFTYPTGSGGGLGGNGGSRGFCSNGPCGACKFLRRKCVEGCIFAPYFDSEQGAAHFAAVHRVFGASNVSKLLLLMPVHRRMEAVATVCYEAHARLRDPVYGCVSQIISLHQQVANLQAQIEYLQAHRAALEAAAPPPQPMMVPAPAPDLIDSVAPPYLESPPALNQMGDLQQPQPQWAHPSMEPPQCACNLQDGAPPPPPASGCGANGAGGCMGGDCACIGDPDDLQMLANEFFHRQC